MITSRQRVEMALNHEEPDKVPLDLGGTSVSGMHVSSVFLLRQALGLDEPGAPIKVVEPYQMLGEIGPDLVEKLGVDVIPMNGSATMFGFKNENWKEWTTFDGTPVLVPEGFNTEPDEKGDILMYPEGDKSAPPSGRMPKGGFYFDSIVRQEPIDDSSLNVEDNLQEFQPISDADIAHYKQEMARLKDSDKAVTANFGGTAFGDIALVPVPMIKYPKGIRDLTEWYMSALSRRDYVYEVFERQCEIALENWARLLPIVSDRISVIFVTGTDFGTQQGPFISIDVYRDLYKPFHKRVNDWVHKNTTAKTFIHSCGSVVSFIEDFIDAGFDILNPVQCSAANMNPQDLKDRFGDRITFWGGGVDTQKTLPFGTPDQVRNEVRERVRVFAPGGGFVFNSIHNVQASLPVENLVAMYDTFNQYRDYPFDH